MLGIVGQLLTNTIAGSLEKGGLFFYSAVFFSFANMMETQAFPFSAGVVRTIVIFGVLRNLIYGRPSKTREERTRPWSQQSKVLSGYGKARSIAGLAKNGHRRDVKTEMRFQLL